MGAFDALTAGAAGNVIIVPTSVEEQNGLISLVSVTAKSVCEKLTHW